MTQEERTNSQQQHINVLKVILCAYEHIFSIVRYRYTSFKQIKLDTDQKLFVNGRFSLPSDIHRSLLYAYHR